MYIYIYRYTSICIMHCFLMHLAAKRICYGSRLGWLTGAPATLLHWVFLLLLFLLSFWYLMAFAFLRPHCTASRINTWVPKCCAVSCCGFDGVLSEDLEREKPTAVAAEPCTGLALLSRRFRFVLFAPVFIFSDCSSSSSLLCLFRFVITVDIFIYINIYFCIPFFRRTWPCLLFVCIC